MINISQNTSIEYHVYDYKTLKKIKDYIVIVSKKKLNANLWSIYMRSIDSTHLDNLPLSSQYERGSMTVIFYLITYINLFFILRVLVTIFNQQAINHVDLMHG